MSVRIQGDAELFYKRQRFLVYRFVISLHIGRESEYVLLLAFLFGLFGSINVELAGWVGNMRDPRIIRLRSLNKHHA